MRWRTANRRRASKRFWAQFSMIYRMTETTPGVFTHPGFIVPGDRSVYIRYQISRGPHGGVWACAKVRR